MISSNFEQIHSLILEKKEREVFHQTEDNSRATQSILKKIAHVQLDV